VKYTAAARAAPRRGGRRSRGKAHGIVLIMVEEQATGGRRERRRRWLRGLLVGTAIGVPALAHFLIQRRARPPRPPRWGRGRRYAGRYGDIAFQFLGEGDSIVLLHSLGPGHDVAEWEGAAELLAERFAVYALDLPGWGRSGAPAAYRPSAYAEAVEDFLDGVVREPAVVVAAGLSAGYALAVAARRPELVRALGLVGPEGLEAEARMGRRAGAGRLASLPLVGVTALDLATSRAALTRHLHHDVYAAPERVDAALVEHHYRGSHRPLARRTLAAYLAGRLRPTLAALAAETAAITQPVWIAWGRAAAEPPVECADLWLQRLPQAALDVFEGAGSLPHAERAAVFCRALEAFLAALPGAG
jgi:pimeloyl-ACP methyl ester carboxylesterase